MLCMLDHLLVVPHATDGPGRKQRSTAKCNRAMKLESHHCHFHYVIHRALAQTRKTPTSHLMVH